MNMIGGDKIDNDCDGVMDEEIVNGLDDDGDGCIDEDFVMLEFDFEVLRDFVIMFLFLCDRILIVVNVNKGNIGVVIGLV